VLAWTGGILSGVLLLLIVAGFALLHSSRFHAYLLRTVQSKASQALGSAVRVRDYSLQWSGISPTVELYGIVVEGAPPNTTPPLLQADSLRVGVTISSLLHRTWYVNDIEINRPVVRVIADRNGQTNLPHPPPSKSGSKSTFDIFQIGVRHLLLQQGELYHNDQKSALSADLHDLALQMGFATAEKKYSGTLSYRDGHVVLQGQTAIPHRLDARFSFTPEEFVMENAELRSGESRFAFQATVHNYSQPGIHANYQAVLNATEFRRILRNDAIPTGIVSLSGAVVYQNDPARSFLSSTRLNGSAHSTSLIASQQGRSLRLDNFRAQYSLSGGNARISAIHANILGGDLNGELRVRDVANAQDAKLTASLRNVSAGAVQRFAVPESQADVRLSGSVSATADASWRKSMANLLANAQVQIAAGVQPKNGQNNIPVNGNIHVRYSGAGQTLAIIPSSYVRTRRTSLSLTGTIANSSSLQLNLQSGDLNEFEQIANAFHASGSAPLNLHGQGSIVASITGSTQNPQLRGQIGLSEVRVRNTAWKSLRTQFSASPSSVSVQQGELIPAGRGRITFQLNAGLQHWAFGPSSSFQAGLHASDLDAKQLAQMSGSTTPVSGVLAVDAEAHGTELSPVGQGTIRLTKAEVAGETINRLRTDVQADGQTVTTQTHLDLAAGSISADFHYQPRQQAYDLNIRSTGIRLQDLQRFKEKNIPIAGNLAIEASGRGTLKDPGLQATLQIPQLSIRNQKVNNIRLIAGVANYRAKFNLDSDAIGTHATAQGTIQLTGDYPADISANTQAIQFQPLLAMYAPAQAANLSGQTELHATLRGPLKRMDEMEAHLEIPQLSLNYKNAIKLAATAPIRADYVRGTLDVKRASIRGNGTDLTFQATIPRAKDAPASVLLQGSVDLQLAQLFSPDITSGGQLRFDIDSYGRRSDPTIQGQVKVVNASFAQAGVPIGLSNGNGTLTLTRDRLNITEFKGQAGGGTVTASGGLIYRPELRADFAMKAEGVRMLYAQSIRATVNSNLALTGAYENALLRGQVSIEQLSLTSGFDLMSFAGQLGGGDATPPPVGGIRENLHLDIALETPGGLNLSSRDLSLAGTAALRVRGSASQPVVLGRVNLTDGELIFNGNRYLVQRGIIDFRNSTRTEPIVDLSVNTTIQQYNVQAHVWGPADHLATNYSSDPALPPSDIINLVAFGKTSEATAVDRAENPSTGMLGAQSLIASQVSSQVTSRISKLAGISQLSVDPVLGSSQQSPGARVNIQQHVTGKIFVTFSTDITSTQQEVIQVEYKVNRRTSFKAVRDQNGGFSLQTNFRKDW
jgi:translocation and assembly module TamB